MTDKENELNNLAYKNYHKKLPDNLNDMILNSLMIPNMILKEIEYLKSVLTKLKENVHKNKETILKLKGNLPINDNNSELSFGPLKQFFSSLIDSDSEDDSGEKDRIRESLSKIKNSKQFLVDTDSDEEIEKPEKIPMKKKVKISNDTILSDTDIQNSDEENELINSKSLNDIIKSDPKNELMNNDDETIDDDDDDDDDDKPVDDDSSVDDNELLDDSSEDDELLDELLDDESVDDDELLDNESDKLNENQNGGFKMKLNNFF